MKSKYNRENIKKLITVIENNYNVCGWQHNGYHLWPILRISLYMYLIRQNESLSVDNHREQPSRLRRILNLLKNVKQYFLLQKKVNSIYVGAPSHCLNYNGVQYNRFFDPLMDMNGSSSLYFNISDTKENVYKPERHFLLSPIAMVFSAVFKLKTSYSTSDKYILELCSLLKQKNIKIDGLHNKLKNNIWKVDIHYYMNHILLKKISPNQIFVLCFYSFDVMGLLIAAHKLAIPTIDMQHGGQGTNHMAYNNWINVPEKGYEALPNSFYTWDIPSANAINLWAENNKKHSAIVFGNPWIDKWKHSNDQKHDYVWSENIVLYTLQPIDEPLEDYLLETIKKTDDKWSWWLRLHPRQMNERDKIISRLKEYGVFDSINIEEATKFPLPEVLMHTKVHITKFSGCALEANSFNVPTIIIDSRGANLYKHYIELNKKMSLNLTQHSKDLIDSIESILA